MYHILSVVNLDTINFSSRSIGSATEDEIDIATIGFTTPIYISPPTKVKKLGVVHTVITSIFNEQQGSVNLNTTMPELLAYSDTGRYGSDAISKPTVDADGKKKFEKYTTTAGRFLLANLLPKNSNIKFSLIDRLLPKKTVSEIIDIVFRFVDKKQQ